MRKINSLLLLVAALLIALPSIAQQKGEQLPVDPSIRIGKLKNGLTYYIRHNENPENLVNFYIAQKVGSIQEEENQRGLAHFLEHMCFNGTNHIPGKSLINYLESIGVKFGADLNAYTSIDETVYNINNVPVDVEGAIDSCLWILRDWADGLTLAGEEIDKEQQNYILQFMYKHDVPSRDQRNTKEYIRDNTKRSVAISLLNSRFSEIMSKETPP